MYKPQPIHPKQNRNQMKYGSNKLCMSQTGKKNLPELLKRIKSILSRFQEINLPRILDEEN